MLQGEFSTAANDHIRPVTPTIADKASFEDFLETPKNMRLFVRGSVGLTMADELIHILPHGAPGCYSRFHGADVWMDQRLVQPVSVHEEALFDTDKSLRSSPWSFAESYVESTDP